MRNPFASKSVSAGFSSPEHQSAGILDNHSIRQSVETQEINVLRSNNSNVVTNLNADLLDGEHASAFEDANANIQGHISNNNQAHTDYMLNTGDTGTGQYAFDIPDDTTGAFGIGQSSNKYLYLNTNNGSEEIALGCGQASSRFSVTPTINHSYQVLNMDSNKITNVTDPTADQDASTKKYVDDTINSKHLTSNTTLNFTTSDTITAMQTAINAVAKDLNGHTLTINFADGNYTLGAFLDFEGFRNGDIIVQGNTGDSTSLSTAQSVYLDFSGQNSYGLYFNNCMATILVQFLKIKIADNAGKACIYGKNTGKMSIYYCYFLSAGKTTSTRAVYGQSAPAYVYNTYVDNFYYGIVEAQCFFVSNNVDSTGTNCNYGLYSVDGGVIGKGGANQPTGTTANELTATGGVIR